jgi:DNA-binding SARP family transcriptional activator
MKSFPVSNRRNGRAGSPVLEIRLLGRMAIAVFGTPVELRSAKGRALLAALALAEGKALLREEAAALLWPDVGSERARLSLRQTIKAVSDALPEAASPVFETTRSILRLEPGLCFVDLDALCACARQGLAHTDLLAGRDPLLAVGSGLKAGAVFDAWLSEQVDARRRDLDRSLEQALLAAADPVSVRDLARAVLALDPMSEAAARRLIAAQIALGQPQKALEAYDALWRALDAGGGAEPSPETHALVAPLSRARGGAALGSPAAVPQVPGPPVVTIRPFETEREADVPALAAARLAFAAAAQPFPDWRVTLEETPGTDFVLRGALLTEAGSRTLLVTLEAARDRRLVSAQRVRLDGSGALAGATVAAILRDMAPVSDARTPDADLSAAARGGRARALADRLRPEALRRARDLATTPGSPRSQAFATEARAAMLAAALDGRPPSTEEIASALDAAERAVDEDALSAAARNALGWCLLMERRFDAAAEEFALAAHLNPADAALQREAALGLALCDREVEARGLLTVADALDPDGRDGAPALRGLIAVALGEPAAALFPEDPAAPPALRAWRAVALAVGGDLEAAAAAVRPLARVGKGAAVALSRALPMRNVERGAAFRASLEAAFDAAIDSFGVGRKNAPPSPR